jgi:acetyltransferase-like isoleucine patch superfamily enzyme
MEAIAGTLEFSLRVWNGLMSRLRRVVYQALGVKIEGHVWLRDIEIKRNFRDIRLAKQVGLDSGVILLVSGKSNGSPKISIGECTYINRHTFIDASHEVRIGRNVGIGPRCYITDHDHGTAPGNLIMSQELVSDSTIIDDGVWLGANVIVLKGVTIGAGSVIAAGSIVASDIPPNMIAGGQPARLVKKR